MVVARFIAWIASLWLLWVVFVGTTQSTELVAGLIASVIVACFVESLRVLGVLDFAPTGRGLGCAWLLPGHVVFDFVLVCVILLRALAAGRRVRGEWVEVPYRVERGPRGRFVRAAATMLGNESANTLVVELAGDRAILHSLDPSASTGKSVL